MKYQRDGIQRDGIQRKRERERELEEMTESRRHRFTDPPIHTDSQKVLTEK
jgi:hypothetical protein